MDIRLALAILLAAVALMIVIRVFRGLGRPDARIRRRLGLD